MSVDQTEGERPVRVKKKDDVSSRGEDVAKRRLEERVIVCERWVVSKKTYEAERERTCSIELGYGCIDFLPIAT